MAGKQQTHDFRVGYPFTSTDKKSGQRGTRNRFVLLLLIFQFAALWPATSQQPANDQVVREPDLPDWVIDYDLDTEATPPADFSNGDVWFLIADRQTNTIEAHQFNHYAYHYLSENGLQDYSQLTISYNPAYQTLQLHTLRIHRDGEIIDHLADQDIKLIQRESGHERQLYDGRLSAILVLKDTREGDILEYAYSIIGDNPVFEGQIYCADTTRWGSPVHQARLRVLWDEDRAIETRSYDSSAIPEIKRNGRIHEWMLNEDSVTPVFSDDGLPSYYMSKPWVEFSDFGSWEDVAKWSVKQYDLSQKPPLELATEIERIEKLPDDEQKILAALRWVQDEIRYLGIMDGMHSHRPYPVDTVLSRRFGDCKDKSTTLVLMLRALGFDAHPALVSTSNRHRVADWLPDPNSFNHLIVHLRFNDRDHWLDPTRSFQRGPLEDLYIPDYGRALIVSKDSTDLTELLPSGFDAATIDITETYSMTDYSGKVDLEVRSRYTGSRASQMRSETSSNSLQSLQKTYLDFYSSEYPSIRTTKLLEVEDDQELDVFTTIEHYQIDHAWTDSEDYEDYLEFEIYPGVIAGEFSKPTTRIRSMPYAISHPRNVTQRIVIKHPTALDFDSGTSKIENDAFTFGLDEKVSERELQLTYTYQSLNDHVDAEDTASYVSDVENTANYLGYQIIVPARYQTMTIAEIDAENAAEAAAGIDDADQPYQLNLTIIVIAGMALMIALVAAWKAYRWDPSSPEPTGIQAAHLTGLGGWLALVGIGITIRPLITGVSVISTVHDWDLTTWLWIANPDSEGYDTLFQIGAVFELVCLCGFFALDCLLLVLFYKKRSSFPRFAITYYLAWIATGAVCAAVFSGSEGFDAEVLQSYYTDLGRAVVQSFIWIPYFIQSTRVRQTFVERLQPEVAEIAAIPVVPVTAATNQGE